MPMDPKVQSQLIFVKAEVKELQHDLVAAEKRILQMEFSHQKSSSVSSSEKTELRAAQTDRFNLLRKLEMSSTELDRLILSTSDPESQQQAGALLAQAQQPARGGGGRPASSDGRVRKKDRAWTLTPGEEYLREFRDRLEPVYEDQRNGLDSPLKPPFLY